MAGDGASRSLRWNPRRPVSFGARTAGGAGIRGLPGKQPDQILVKTLSSHSNLVKTLNKISAERLGPLRREPVRGRAVSGRAGEPRGAWSALDVIVRGAHGDEVRPRRHAFPVAGHSGR